jgi:predicted nucleic acid-binding protein
MKKILVDTNIYSFAMRGDENAVAALRNAREILLCPIVVGELLSGFRHGNREQQNRTVLESFIHSPRVRLIPVTTETAEFYTAIWYQLRKDGVPIPTNDIWIAACTFEHGAQLVTADKHFQHVLGLISHFP